jgi:hypothetical protein
VNKRYLFYKRYQNIWLKTAESGDLLFVSFIPIYIFSLIWPFPSENTICNILFLFVFFFVTVNSTDTTNLRDLKNDSSPKVEKVSSESPKLREMKSYLKINRSGLYQLTKS